MKLFITTVLSLAVVTATLPLVSLAQAYPPDAAQQSQTIAIVRSSSQASQKAPAEYFTGSVRVTPLFDTKAPSRVSGGSVTFEPGARSAWHTHPLGQVLIITAGTGWIQSWGGPVQEMRQGDIVRIPPGVKHWHGASATSSMTHTAIQEEIDGKNLQWLEKVSDQQYAHGPSVTQQQKQTKGTNDMNKEPFAIKKTFGDFSPKLVQLTDDVLFGDVWERPELSKRDRSLVTVTALIAGGNTEQLPFHLKRAKENGVTEAEIIETITHLAFYSGWPKAMSAITVAKETFKPQP
jgi:4-carboxymuconolactone decarboxylase